MASCDFRYPLSYIIQCYENVLDSGFQGGSTLREVNYSNSLSSFLVFVFLTKILIHLIICKY